jgi:ADP-ribose pyrophosphatase
VNDERKPEPPPEAASTDAVDAAAVGRKEAELVSSRVVFRGRILEVRVDEVVLGDGTHTEREKVVHPGAVVVVALDSQGRVALVTQYRHAVACDLVELPAGTLEEGEDPLETARRELHEEAGVTAASWQPLGSFFSSPGFLRERLHAFLARDLTRVEQALEDDEDIDVHWVPFDALLSGQPPIHDAKTLATLCLAARHLERG